MRGLAKGLESKDIVSSPTFMLEKVYSGRLELHHYDLFRLGESGIVGLELAEVFDDPSSVKVIEWGGVAGDLLPNERLVITIKVTSEESRAFVFSIPSKLAYLLETIS